MPVEAVTSAAVDDARGAPTQQLLAAAAQPDADAWQRALGAIRRQLARADDPLQRVALRSDLVEAHLRRAEATGSLPSAPRLLALAADTVADARAIRRPDILLRALDVSVAALRACAPHSKDERTARIAAEWLDAAALLNPGADVERWAAVHSRLATILSGIYYRSRDRNSLQRTIAGYRAIRAATSPRHHPSIWAWASLNLAMVMRDSAEADHDLRGLRKAIAPARAALRVFTRNTDVLAAAAARNSWAVALTMIADLAYSRDLIDEADRLWDANEQIWPRDTRPEDWARMTNSRALGILTTGEMDGDPAALARALRLFDDIGAIWTKERDPEYFAFAAINKGGARRRLAAITGNHRHLQMAITEQHQALMLLTGRRNPVLKGGLLHVLGGAESELAYVLRDEPLAAAGERRQLAAIRLYEKAGSAAHDLALARNNLGAALLQATALGRAGARLARAGRHLGEAVALYGPEARHGSAIRARRNLFAVRLERAIRARNAPSLHGLAAEIDHYTARSPSAVAWERAALRLLAANARVAAARLSASPNEAHELAGLLRRLFDDPTLPPAAMIAVGLELGRVLAAARRADRAIDVWAITQDRLWQALLRADGAAERRGLARMANARTAIPDAYAGRLGLGVALGDDLAMALLNRDAPSDRERAVIALSRSRGVLRAAVAAPDALYHLRGGLRAANARLRKLDESVVRRAALGPAQAEAATRELAAAVRAAEDAERAFRDAVVAMGLSRAPTPDIAGLAGAVPPGGALVVFALGVSGSAAIIMRQALPAEIDVLPLPFLTRADVEALTSGNGGGGLQRGWFPALRRFNDSVAGTGNARLPHWAVAEWNSAIRDVLEQLWARAMGPLDAHLKTLRLAPGAEVAISAPGLLASLPLHAAGPAGGGDTFLDHWAVRWVLHTDPAPATEQSGAADSRLLAVVDPLEDLLEPGVPDPVERFFPPERKTVLRGRAATVAAVMDQLPRHDCVSFTCHGSYAPADPESSGLDLVAPRLGPGGRPMADRLSVAALRALTPVRRQLCILAACETAISDIADVVDELEGLQAEFLDLGFAAVIGASWPVASTAADSLIERFCGTYFGAGSERYRQSPAAALRLAQLAMRAAPTGVSNFGSFRLIAGPAATPLTVDEPRLAPDAPFWWAGFRLLGRL